MKRTLIAVAALVGLASAANAASVSVTADQAVYTSGDTITLTVVATANLGETGSAAFGDLLLSGTGSVLGGSVVSQSLTSFGGAIVWIDGAHPCSPTVCTAMNQIVLGTFPVDNTPLNIAVITYTAGAAGTVNVAWDNTTFDFFGAVNQPGTSFNIVPIPEPTTAALLGLGLLGLAVTGRRRA
jgi:hypothetical protein